MHLIQTLTWTCVFVRGPDNLFGLYESNPFLLPCLQVGLETKVHGRVDLHTSKANDIIHALRQKIFMEMYPGMDEKENAQIVVKVPEDRYVKNVLNQLDQLKEA